MKKKFLSISFIMTSIIPIISIASCSSQIVPSNFKSQYDLFTPELVIKENISNNIASSIDQNLVSNIYSIPSNLIAGTNYSFSFLPSKDGATLELFVQLYDYKGDIVKYSDTSDNKLITSITGFRQLTVAEENSINLQYDNFKKLSLTGNPQKLPSSIEKFSDITGSAAYIEDNKYKYSYNIIPNNTDGKLEVELELFYNDYPLKSSLNFPVLQEVVGFSTQANYQAIIDSFYKGNNEIRNVNLTSEVEFASINKFSSSITDVTTLKDFYISLNVLTSNKINIPSFLLNPTEALMGIYMPEINIKSNDNSGNTTITINFYDINTGLIVEPSPGINKIKTIANFKKPSSEMLKATMIAYQKFSTFPVTKNNEVKLTNEINDWNLAGLIPSNPVFSPFQVTVKKYSTGDSAATPAEETFTFNPTPEFVSSNLVGGFATYKINLTVDFEGNKMTINPPISVVEDNLKPSFSNANLNPEFYLINFLKPTEKEANNLYWTISNTIANMNQKTLLLPTPQNINSNINFDLLWSNLYTAATTDPVARPAMDPIGIPLSDSLEIRYNFEKTLNTDLNYDIHSSNVNGQIYQWVKIKATVHAIPSGFEYLFSNLILPGTETTAPQNPTFEFNFAIKLSNVF